MMEIYLYGGYPPGAEHTALAQAPNRVVTIIAGPVRGIFNYGN